MGAVGDWGMVLGLNDNGESDTVRNGIQEKTQKTEPSCTFI